MRFREAQHLIKNEEILIIEKGGKCPKYRIEKVVEISIEDKDVFVRCGDGKLYHHTALKRVFDIYEEV